MRAVRGKVQGAGEPQRVSGQGRGPPQENRCAGVCTGEIRLCEALDTLGYKVIRLWLPARRAGWEGESGK